LPGFYLLSADQLAPYKERWMNPVRKVIEKKIGKDGAKALDIAIKISKELS
jgi:hypothetical protein